MTFKKKAIIGIAAGLFAVATVFNMNMLNEKSGGDVSLDALSVMAQAGGETGDNGPFLCVNFPRLNRCAWDWKNGYPCRDC